MNEKAKEVTRSRSREEPSQGRAETKNPNLFTGSGGGDFVHQLINALTDGVIIYNAEGEIMSCNDIYRQCYPSISDKIIEGAHLEDLLRATVAAGHVLGPEEDEEEWVKDHLDERLNPSGKAVEKLIDGRWWRFSEYKTDDGAVISQRRDITDIRSRESALQASENRYRRLIELAPDLIAILTDGVITLINTAGVKILGAKDPDILIGQPFSDFVHADFREAIDEHLKKVAEDESWIGIKLTRVGGAVVDAELSALPFDREDSKAVMVVVRDTTERERSAEALLHREERLRGIMNTVIDGIISIDMKGSIDSFNAAAEGIFGYTEEEVLGKNVKILMPAPYRDEHDGYLSRYLRTGEGRIIGKGREVLGRRKDGSLFPVDLAVSELRRDGRSHFIGVVRDITERKNAEAVLKESEERYALALDGTNEVLWDWDIERKKLYISPRIQEIFGIEPLPLVDPKAWMRKIHPDDFDQYRNTLIKHLKGGTEFFQCECRLTSGDDDNPVWCRMRGVALRNEDGRAYRMAGSLGEISKRKRAEVVLRQTMEKAEIASRAKTDFLANMSHELRTPLNAIIGFSEIMQEGFFGDLGNPRYDEYIKNINESGRHLLEIISDILDVSRIEAGTMDLQSIRVDVVEVVDSALRLVRERAERSNIAIRRRIQKDLPSLRSEPRRLKQILLNLLSNAIKFTPDGGKVTLKASLLKSGNLTISVGDTGIGMAPNEIEIALSPFGQVESRLTRKHEGTGLGLPLTKAFVELHGGTLRIRSSPGRGTTVSVLFPSERLMR